MTQSSGRRMLDDRYELTRRISQCGETSVYIGRDVVSERMVTIREFCPAPIMERDEQECVRVLPGCEVQYKSLSSDYEELCRYLMGLPTELSLIRPFDVLWRNDTVYSVEWYVGAETVGDYLDRMGRPLGWVSLKKMLAPVVRALGRMHADGIYHRGISPETVVMTAREELLLSGFCIPAARTADSEIAATLYFGYSAPEQYSSNSWQGSWSDVYSLAAVCYLALTGITPIEWRQRGERHPLTPPSELAPDLPTHISDALLKALSVDLRTRYRTVEEFWIALLDEPGSGTVTYPLSVVKRTDPPVAQSLSAAVSVRPLIFSLVIISLVAVLALGISYRLVDTYFSPLIPTQTGNPPEESSAFEEPDPQIYIPNLLGNDIEKVLLDPLYQSLFTFQIERVFSEVTPAGVILSQYPKAGAIPQEDGKSEIRVWVCKGSERAPMPALEGLTLARATAILNGLEIGYVEEPVELPGAENGTVASTSIPPDGIVYRTVDTVILYVVQNPEEEKAPSQETPRSSSEYIYQPWKNQPATESPPYSYQR